MDLNSFSNLNSLIPSVNQQETQKQMESMQQQMMKQGQMQQNVMMRNQMEQQFSKSPWYLTPDDKQRYQKIFESQDKDRRGIINDN
mmetsp:Transcript_20453/g.19437  ORF Transcript_20453/g.19437 Transcript_20453/m.19437 type:complete len:86 (-) Transcript_20453:370-627(-)